MIDPDFGALVQDETGRYLSIQRIAQLLMQDPKRLSVVDIGHKTWLKSQFNHEEPMPQFSWSPDKSTTNPTIDPERYMNLLMDLTYQYRIYDHGAVRSWKKPKKFKRDGTPNP